MFGPEAQERDAFGGGGRRMRRGAPVDEVRHEPVRLDGLGIRVAPGEQDSIGPLPAPRNHLAQLDAVARGLLYQLFECPPIRDPCDELRLGEVVDAEWAGLLGFRLVGVASDDFQIRRRPERDQRIPGATTGVWTSRDRPDTEELLDPVDAGLEIAGGVHQMIHPG